MSDIEQPNNHLVLSFDSAKPNTRRQHQKHLRGASALASSPRVRTLSSPGTPLEVQVAALQSPAGRREVALHRPGSQLLEDVSLLEIDCSVEVVTLSEEIDSPVRSSTPAPPGLPQLGSGHDIMTSRSQVLPDLGWMQDLNVTLETPPSPAPLPLSPAPALLLLSLQQQARTLELAADTVETEKHVPAPVEDAVEHLLEMLAAAVPDAAAQKEPVLASTVGLQPPLQPTPAKAKVASIDDSCGDDELYIFLGGETCSL